MERTCNKCGETKPIIQFYKDAGKKDGYKNSCKECTHAYNRAYRKKGPSRINRPKEEDILTPLELEIYNFFKKMGVKLKKESLEQYAERLEKAKDEGRYFSELNAIEKENEVGPDDYQDDFLEELREERKMINITRISGKWQKDVTIHQYTMDGEYIQSFDSIADASRELTGSNNSSGNISSCAAGNVRQSLGYIWSYYLDEEI